MFALACGGSGEAVTPTPVGPERNETSQGQTEVTTEEVRDPRELPSGATYADLVAAARALDERSDAEPSTCLLRPAVDGASGPRLEAEVAVAVRPLPEAAVDVLARVEGRGPVRGLSRWGQRGAGRLSALAFTPVGAARVATAVMFIGREGVRVRQLDGEMPAEHAGLLDHAALPLALQAIAAEAVWVTADAALPVTQLREWLALADSSANPRSIAFAVLLPDGVPLPDAPSHAGTRGLCPEGLSAATDDGSMEPADAVAALGPFREGASRCLRMAPAEAAGGGRLDLAFRVGSDGEVAEACARRDSVQSEAVRTCVLDALRGVRFPVPDPPGSTAQIALPVVLHPQTEAAPRTICQ